MSHNRLPNGIVYLEHIDISSLDWAVSAETLAAYGPPDAIWVGVTGDISMKLHKVAAAHLVKNVPVGLWPFSVIMIDRANTSVGLRAGDSLEAVWYYKGPSA